MPTATMTSKNQLTVPEAVRQRLRLVAGDKVDFYENAQGETVVKPVRGNIRQLRGIVKWDGPSFSDEELDEAIGEAIVERYKRSFE